MNDVNCGSNATQRPYLIPHTAAQAARAMADNHAANVLPAIREIAASGASLRQIAAELNRRDVKTTRGGPWYATTVRNMLAREAKIEGAAT